MVDYGPVYGLPPEGLEIVALPERSPENPDAVMFVDAGRDLGHASSADRVLLVVRPCFVALRRAVAMPVRPDGVIVVTEEGRSLRASDVEAALGVPVIAEIAHDPALARAVDSGVLASRIAGDGFRSLTRSLRKVAQ